MNNLWKAWVGLWTSMGPLIRLPDGISKAGEDALRPWKSTAKHPWFEIEDNRCYLDNGKLFARGSIVGNMSRFVFDPKADYGGVGENLYVHADDVEFVPGESLRWNVRNLDVMPIFETLALRLVLQGDVIWLRCVPELRVDYTSSAYMWNMQYGMVRKSYTHVAWTIVFYSINITLLVLFIVYVTVDCNLSMMWMRFFVC